MWEGYVIRYICFYSCHGNRNFSLGNNNGLPWIPELVGKHVSANSSVCLNVLLKNYMSLIQTSCWKEWVKEGNKKEERYKIWLVIRESWFDKLLPYESVIPQTYVFIPYRRMDKQRWCLLLTSNEDFTEALFTFLQFSTQELTILILVSWQNITGTLSSLKINIMIGILLRCVCLPGLSVRCIYNCRKLFYLFFSSTIRDFDFEVPSQH